MRSGVIAQKVGMTRVFTEAGEHIPVTVLKLGNCQVLGHRTSEKNGYVALQLGSGARKTGFLPKAGGVQCAGAEVEMVKRGGGGKGGCGRTRAREAAAAHLALTASAPLDTVRART